MSNKEQIGKELENSLKESQSIKKIENTLKEVQEEIKELKRKYKKPEFERVKNEERFYSINMYSNGPNVIESYEDYAGGVWSRLTQHYNADYFKNNNYFHTKERAEEIAKKIKFLLKLERIHDILCPDHVSDWKDYTEDKWYIYYCYYKGKYCVSGVCVTQTETNVYFPDKETAERACIMLNNGEI